MTRRPKELRRLRAIWRLKVGELLAGSAGTVCPIEHLTTILVAEAALLTVETSKEFGLLSSGDKRKSSPVGRHD
jgi:hypothetical protein